MTEPGQLSGFLHDLLDETVGPYTEMYVFPVPDADMVAELDDVRDDPFSVIAVMAGDEDLADAILEDLGDKPNSEVVHLVDAMLDHFGLLDPPAHGYARLARELERYGPGIEFDLQNMGVNLYDFVLDPGRWPWTKMFRLLRFAPIGGGYRSMVADDVELAMEQLAAEEREDAAPVDERPPSYGWTNEREVLTQVADALKRIEHATYATSPKHRKVNRPPPKPAKRPKLARERAANLRVLREHDEIASKMLGNRYVPKGW